MVVLLYKSVFNTIIQRVADGIYLPGTMLPSEKDLGAELNVSQGTARKALIELEHKGVVQRHQGRGTFVTLRTPENSLFRFFRLRDAAGKQVSPELVSQTILCRKARRTEKARLFGNPEKVFELIRIRSFEGKPLSHEVSIVSTQQFPGLQQRAPLPNTLYVFFQRSYSCIIISAEENLKAGLLGAKIGVQMKLDPVTPVIVVQRRAFDLRERVVELRTSTVLTENVSYFVQLD